MHGAHTTGVDNVNADVLNIKTILLPDQLVPRKCEESALACGWQRTTPGHHWQQPGSSNDAHMASNVASEQFVKLVWQGGGGGGGA